MYKVLHLIKSLGRGGAEMLLPETLRVHDRNEFEFVYGFFLPHKDQLVTALTEQDVRVKCFGGSSVPAILAKLPAVAAFVRSERVDLIHCHLPIAGVVGRLAGALTGVPVVYTEHNKQERYHPATRMLNLKTMGINRRVIAVSQDVEKSIRDNFEAGKKTHIQSLLNGVNTGRFAPRDYDKRRCRAELDLPADATVIGTVCVFRTQKRLHLWLELARRLFATHPNVFFVVVGDGPEEGRIKQLATDYGLEDRIVFPGRLSEVRPWLAATDIYLMTSEFEGLPIAMLEAMSMELPIVATRAGGIGEAVTDGQHGFLSPVDEWETLLSGLVRLTDDADLRARMGSNARERVVSDFSINTMAGAIESAYREVLDQ